MHNKIYGIFFCVCFLCRLNAASILLHTKSATVWLPQQKINGSLQGISEQQLRVHFNDSAFIIAVHEQKFIIDILLEQKHNCIWVETINANNHITSDTVFFELGYQPLPLVVPSAKTKDNKIFLHAAVKTNPYNLPLKFCWKDDERNPSRVNIIHAAGTEAEFYLPDAKGNYFINLTVIAGEDSVQYETLIIKSDSIHCFNIRTDHAAWIDSAVIYEITPYIFTDSGNYKSIREKLPELHILGINCVWLQPLFKTYHGHQGYDVTDFFSLREDLGSEEDLHQLIITAKKLNIKVLFDFVPNHTSVNHPYAKDAIAFDSDSHYYSFYQHKNDGAMYSSLYERDSLGFYHYFWKNMFNLNYDNEEVQQWIIEACKYWLKKFDLDGFRFDAMWAINARNDSFGSKLQTALKSIKPDILFLAEDKGENSKVYVEGFDAAYDWRSDTTWISKWSWQADYTPQSDLTIFNFTNENKRGKELGNALFSGDQTHLRMRFMENNDLPGFIKYHELQRTKMIAAFMFSLPGIPLIYNGQETGHDNKIYSVKPVFKEGESIQLQDTNGLFNYYKQLIALRKKYNSLRSFNMQKIPVSAAGSVIALLRWTNNEEFIIVMNMSKNAQMVNIDLKNIHQHKNYISSFTDVLSDENFYTADDKLKLVIPAYSTKFLMIK